MVEILRHEEEEDADTLTVDGVPYKIQVERKGNRVSAVVQGDGWSHSISQTVFEPEAFMRMLTLVQE